MYSRIVAALLACVFALTAQESRADIKLPHIFGSHMVMQRDQPLPIWGKAAAGETVTVKLGDDQSTATADADGHWRVTLKPRGLGDPLTLKVSGDKTEKPIELNDILMGEVWVCSGQSNMEAEMRKTCGRQDIAQSEHPQLRLITVPKMTSGRPKADFEGSWSVCTPGSVAGFSAVAYYFGAKLNDELNVPVGLIHSSWGGSPIEPWTPRASFDTVPALKPMVAQIEKANETYRKAMLQGIDKVAAWLNTARPLAEHDQELPLLPQPEAKHPLQDWGPTSMYNGMIHPLVPFAIRGAIWYQGESNNGDGLRYMEKMQGLIDGWRKAWQQGDFPFLYVELAPYSEYPPGNLEGIWEAQLSALSIPNTGMAVTTDLVDKINDIHPQNKRDVGRRLALWALAKTYGKDQLVYSGPIYKSHAIEGDRIRIRFDSLGSGLSTRDGNPPNSFQVAKGSEVVEANAVIDGDSVVVWSDKVSHPEAVRFGWWQRTNPNLTNKEGLPASPFRTDIGSLSFSPGSQFAHSKTVTIEAAPAPTGKIHYTLDGSPPTAASPIYSSPIHVNKTTTVSARYIADDGRQSLTARTTYTQVEATPWDGKELSPGLNFAFYEGEWRQLPDFPSLQPARSGETESLKPLPTRANKNFAIRFTGLLKVPTTGEYVLYLKSDDGSRIYVDGKLQVNNDGAHAPLEAHSEKVRLEAGFHPIILDYLQVSGGTELELQFEGPGIAKQPVSDSAYFRTE